MTFKILTLGCKVNTYESSVMQDKLINGGYVETSDDIADIYIINTCTVTNTSDNKSLKVIRSVRRKNPNSIILVCGCMTQVIEDITKIDAEIIIGNRYKNDVVSLIEEYINTKNRIIKIEDIMNTPFESMILNNYNKTRAFVKIEDGCENFCSYCIIPYARGSVRSKEPRLVISEIINLVKDGHKEVVLTGIHTGHYGEDLNNYNFACLLKEIVKIPGLKRLRISSIEITELTDEVLDIIKNSNIIVSHLHVPLQAGSNKILELMNRKYNKQYFIDKINKIRNIRPNISLTTDIIVGFPGETEELFEETLDTVKIIRFSKIHVFPFSLRKGTKAEVLPYHLDELTKKNRVHKLMELSRKLEIEYMNKFINKELEIISEVIKENMLIGHTDNYLNVKCLGNNNDLHQIVKVKISKLEYPYLIGEKV